MVIIVSEFSKEIDRIIGKVEDAYREAIDELEELRGSITKWYGYIRLGRLHKRLEDIVEDFEEELLEAKRRLREVKREAEKRGDETTLRKVEEVDKLIEDRVKEFTKKYESTIKDIEENYPGAKIRKGPHWVAISILPQRLASIVSREVGEALRTAMEEIKRATESVSTIVSSIRLREEDAKIIDELVDSGIFKSRSEAVAFFTRKGIEASKEWLEKVRENIGKIRELQEEVRRELEKT